MDHFLRGNTIALLALFLALGGTTYAAVSLPKNSVGTKQLKKNAVTAVKIKNGNVTGAKLKNGSVTNAKIAADAVTAAKVKDDSLTGADVLESSLGTVPSAINATNATTAASATNAANAANASLLQGKAATSFASASQEAVHLIGAAGQPAFENGWLNFGTPWSPAGFWKDSLGVVHLQGTLKGGTAVTAFTLPAGYRPASNLFVPMANKTFGYILATGQVQPNTTGDTGLDGISFRSAGTGAAAPSAAHAAQSPPGTR